MLRAQQSHSESDSKSDSESASEMELAQRLGAQRGRNGGLTMVSFEQTFVFLLTKTYAIFHGKGFTTGAPWPVNAPSGRAAAGWHGS